MIGKIVIGKSFRGCISYCLGDKLKISEGEQVFKNRAEVLCYNLCFGNKLELIKQFGEVRKLNTDLSKPVMHIILSMAKGEQVNKGTLITMVEDCGKEMGFEKNQYIAIAHNDTGHQHIHIVVNRIDFDGKALKDSHNYRKIASYCRTMELKHNLQQVLNPRRYLSHDQRNLPRHDQRKEQLKNDIRACLLESKMYPQFEQLMKQKNYQVIKARGIAFIDSKKVKVKGSEVGYPLSKIEKILAMPREQRLKLLQMGFSPRKELPKIHSQPSFKEGKQDEIKHSILKQSNFLLSAKSMDENINPALLNDKRHKKRRHRL